MFLHRFLCLDTGPLYAVRTATIVTHQTLAKIPDRINRGGRPPTYPWDDWFDPEHNARTLVPGEDFTVPVRSFRSAARQAAASRGLEVKVVGVEDGVLLVYAEAGRLEELLAG